MHPEPLFLELTHSEDLNMECHYNAKLDMILQLCSDNELKWHIFTPNKKSLNNSDIFKSILIHVVLS